MLSVLIATYNRLCVDLVKRLHQEASGMNIPFEILVADDCSTPEYQAQNSEINNYSHCRYILSDSNVGPAAIRNRLADESQYPYLLFLDSDAYPVAPTFLSTYLRYAQSNTVVCGGFCYKSCTNYSEQYSLRYTYGTRVESQPAKVRNRAPHDSFFGISFLCAKEVFVQVRFDDTMRFGYEDVHFGNRLKKQGVTIIHIDNPVYHLGLDTNKVYLKKIRVSVENLSCHFDKMYPHIRLLRWYMPLKRLRLTRVVASIFERNKVRIERNLTGPKPSLRLFAFYKLGYLCSIHPCRK